MKKKYFVLSLFLIYLSFILNAENFVNYSYKSIYGKSSENANIFFYENGIIRSYHYSGENENIILNFKIIEENKNKLIIQRHTNINGDFSTDEYIFSYDDSFIFVKKNDEEKKYEYKKEKNGLSIYNEDLTLSYTDTKYLLKQDTEEFRFSNSMLFDYTSYGEFWTAKNIFPSVKVKSISSDVVLFDWCSCDEWEEGFSYSTKEGTFSIAKSENLKEINFLYRFFNYILQLEKETSDFYINPFLFFVYDISNKPMYPMVLKYKASSELKENETIYSVNNLTNKNDLPWASANGYGIGDKITLYIEVQDHLKLNFYNGFQLENKPYLFKQNSRVKKIKVMDIDTQRILNINVLDTLEKQSFDLSEFIGSKNRTVRLEIEILDVYEGSKYKDLCIQSIYAE